MPAVQKVQAKNKFLQNMSNNISILMLHIIIQ